MALVRVRLPAWLRRAQNRLIGAAGDGHSPAEMAAARDGGMAGARERCSTRDGRGEKDMGAAPLE